MRIGRRKAPFSFKSMMGEQETMRFRGGLLAMALLAAPLVAEAQPFQGFYIGGGAGYNLPENDPLAGGGQIEPGGGFVGLGSVGYGLGNGFRFEVEGNFRQGSLSSDVGRGDCQQQRVPAYLWRHGQRAVRPRCRLAVALSRTSGAASAMRGRICRVSAPLPPPNSHCSAAASTRRRARSLFQAIAGLSFPMPGVPGLSLTAEYRFFGSPGSETFSESQTIEATDPTASVKLRHLFDHSFMFGVRYAFGQVPPAMAASAAPAAAPAPAVQPARSYLVFFDWDKATLTDRARQIVKEAADNSTHVQYTRIEVNGYTDTSGTPQYNMGLSIRRATAVKAELIKDGVPAAAIATQGFGETHLLVPTGAGVREPQNRRVEIIVR